MRLASREIAAAGAVVWREHDGVVEVAVVHRQRYDDWSLPKGKLDRDESARLAAWREVHEETGARVALGRYLGRTRYRVRADRKVVDYFAAKYLSGSFVPSDEVDSMRWLPVTSAEALLTYDHDRTVLAALTALPVALTTLVVVRHAKAGSRAEWTDVDELRPLSHNGEKQVPPIRRLASVYGVDRVYSAPLVRCVKTVQPVADDLGEKVLEEELLAEKSYAGMEEATLRRALEIVAQGGVPLLCSQGGVIPDLVSRLANHSGVELTKRVEAKKGSVWALFFSGTELVAGDYVAVP
ncbi:NUDIX hydrolase [Actinophytocola sp.]|uniref:NUDIX hydrolase n=1 Tax=Actinophytocola sp. TaxID=1872138 RepID=UPI002ED31CE8